jgi:signal transduction histidine kinase
VKAVRLLLIVSIGACNTQRPFTPNPRAQYNEFLRIDSLANVYPDSAFYYYFNAAKNFTDSGYKATALQRMALIQQTAEDYNGSNESAIRSVALFSEKKPQNYSRISYNYNLLGSNCLDLQRYDDAFGYYDQAIRYADSMNIPIYKINKGVAYQKIKEYDKAISLYEDVLKYPVADTAVYSRVRSNLAKARWLRNPDYPAAGELHEARELRQLINDQLGLNASYSHLADYYMKSRPDSARDYAEKMYHVAIKLDRYDDQAEALEKLARLSSGANFNDYFPQYVFIKDSMNLARTNDRNQFADIRFNFEEARANNLLLEKDNSEKRFRIIRQRVIIYSTVALFTVLGILGFLWNKKRKRLQELQTRNAIRESELKTSQKVHDVVANGLYRIMADLEHNDNIQKEKVLDSIEYLYEQSRDISYEHPIALTGHFPEQLNTMLTSFATTTTKVLVVGNQEKLWSDTTKQAKVELMYVLQELMVNMKKHSGAHNVVVRFQQAEGTIIVYYKDDGRGLPPGFREGNGMRNTGNRINKIGGTIIFDSNPGKGLNIEILVPISTST